MTTEDQLECRTFDILTITYLDIQVQIMVGKKLFPNNFVENMMSNDHKL